MSTIAEDQLEPDAYPIDTDKALTSIAISCKRIADALDKLTALLQPSYGGNRVRRC